MSEPVKILDIHKNKVKGQIKTKYVLNEEELNKLLDPIKDKKIAVIPIVGASRKGKSFILNYMTRYLLDYKNSDWIGQKTNPLKGKNMVYDIEKRGPVQI